MKLELRDIRGLHFTFKGDLANTLHSRLREDTRVKFSHTLTDAYYTIRSGFVFNVGELDLHLSDGDVIKMVLN